MYGQCDMTYLVSPLVTNGKIAGIPYEMNGLPFVHDACRTAELA